MTEILETESSTRDRILHLVVESGPVSVLDLARDLHLTPAGVRRHVAALELAGQVTVHSGRATGPTGRGRPARRYVATGDGQASLDCTYAELAAQAIAYLGQVGGQGAVTDFAERRAGDLERGLAAALAGAPVAPVPAPDAPAGAEPVRERTDALARALSDVGYAASVRVLPGGRAVQLCQGHCPVLDVATEYPALCEAETRMLSRLLGVHVQRLSTLATGGHVCTTHVPVQQISPRPTSRRPATEEARS